jgi:hypothetical protein
MPLERKLNVSLSLKIKGESTSVKVLPWDPFAAFNVAVLIYSFVHIGCAFGSKVFGPKARHENSVVGMDPMATHCRKLIVTGIYQANSYQKFVMSYECLSNTVTKQIKT